MAGHDLRLWTVAGRAALIAQLDEARAEIARLREDENRSAVTIGELREEIARLRASPEADAMERARNALGPYHSEGGAVTLAESVARALTDYGDQRAREARTPMEDLRKSCVEILGQDANWPAHGNVPVAIAAALQLHVTGAREARAAAVEEAAQRLEANPRWVNAAAAVRALHDTPPQPGWRDIASARRDGTFVWVWAAPYDTLPGFVEYARYHEDAGWCVDELRNVTLWQPAQQPPAPPQSEGGDG